MAVALAAHDSILRSTLEDGGGTVVKSTGDGLLRPSPAQAAAVTAAVECQRETALGAGLAGDRASPRSHRHSPGSVESRDGDFHGPALNRVARLLSIGHGGQVLVSGTTAELARGGLPARSN